MMTFFFKKEKGIVFYSDTIKSSSSKRTSCNGRISYSIGVKFIIYACNFFTIIHNMSIKILIFMI